MNIRFASQRFYHPHLIVGRVSTQDMVHPITGDMLVQKGDALTANQVDWLAMVGYDMVDVEPQGEDDVTAFIMANAVAAGARKEDIMLEAIRHGAPYVYADMADKADWEYSRQELYDIIAWHLTPVE